MKALVIAKTADASRELAAGARTMADEVILVSVGSEPTLNIADKALRLEVPTGNILEDAYLSLHELLADESPSIVLIENDRQMKTLGGRLAAQCGVSAICGVIAFEEGVASCRYYGGIAERGYRSTEETSIYVVSSGTFKDLEAHGTELVQELAFRVPEHCVERLSSAPLSSASGVNLQKAEIVLCAGRGFSEESDLDLLNSFATKIGAETACTRPLTEGVDWFPKGSYIGVSGLEITPRVYVGIGVSGQMQHMVGCSKAEKIIAINKDENAPIFKLADLGICGDLKEVLPALNAAID